MNNYSVETDTLYARENGSTATVGFSDQATEEQVKQLIDAMRSRGYAWVSDQFYDPESGFTFMEMER